MSAWTFADVWEAIAARQPDQPALIQGGRVVTWGQFDARADALAAHLAAHGVSSGGKVAAYLYNGPEYLETFYAAFKAGLAPINTNYRYGGDELTYLFDNADAEAVVFHASFAATADKVRGRLPKVKAWIAVAEEGHPVPDWALDYDAIVAGGAPRFEAPWGRSGDDLLIMYTGGTTGMPKGVMWRQEDLFKALGGGANLLLGLPPLETVAEAGQRAKAVDASGAPLNITIPVAPLMHATGQFISFGTLISGGAVATLTGRKFDPAVLFDEVERLEAAGLIIVGPAFAAPMLETLDANPGRWTMPSLKRIASSGAMWGLENKQGLLKHLPNVMLMDSLGSSEALGLASSTSGAGQATSTAKFVTGPNAAVFTEDGVRVEPGLSRPAIGIAVVAVAPTGAARRRRMVCSRAASSRGSKGLGR